MNYEDADQPAAATAYSDGGHIAGINSIIGLESSGEVRAGPAATNQLMQQQQQMQQQQMQYLQYDSKHPS